MRKLTKNIIKYVAVLDAAQHDMLKNFLQSSHRWTCFVFVVVVAIAVVVVLERVTPVSTASKIFTTFNFI